MDVIDSSTWVYAVTRTCPDAVNLLDEIIYRTDGSRVAVSPYIFNEVIDGIARSITNGRAIDEAQTRFSEIVHKNSRVDAPDYRDVREMDIRRVRNDVRVQMMAETYGIQPKDVPIVTCAYESVTDHGIIYTSDEELSQFNPSRYGLEQLSVRYVDCSGC